MTEKPDYNRMVSETEQAFTTMSRQFIPGLGSIYRACIEEGFSPDQAMVIVVKMLEKMMAGKEPGD